MDTTKLLELYGDLELGDVTEAIRPHLQQTQDHVRDLPGGRWGLVP